MNEVKNKFFPEKLYPISLAHSQAEQQGRQKSILFSRYFSFLKLGPLQIDCDTKNFMYNTYWDVILVNNCKQGRK